METIFCLWVTPVTYFESTDHHPKSPMRKLSQSQEDYIKTIFKLQKDEPVSTMDIAQAADVAPATVTKALKKLAEMGLVSYRSYQGVTLTAAGRKVALEVIRHHRLLELYLKEVMGYSWDRLHEEAEHLEHHISEEFEDRLDEMLGYPTSDPHGHPIPARDGSFTEVNAVPLGSIPCGRSVVVHHLADDNTDLLAHLEDLALMPGSTVEIVEIAPFDGPVTIRHRSKKQVIGRRVADSVFVIPPDPE